MAINIPLALANANSHRLSCTKLYVDFPFAHRQHMHDGHCSKIHGHNWSFEFTFTADHVDSCGFVIDFGKMQWLKGWLTKWFDHTLVLNSTDPHLDYIRKSLDDVPLADIMVVPDASCEGLAKWIFEQVDLLILEHVGVSRGVRLIRVTVKEDSKNSATWEVL